MSIKLNLILAGAVALCCNSVLSQNTYVSWSSFNMGYALSAHVNSAMKSAVGQVFGGKSQQGNSIMGSGFLAPQLSPVLIRANVRFFLEGPYNSGTLLMNKALRTDGHLASHFGSIPIPAEAVDSINVELRNAASASSSTTRKYRPAWLLTDGTIRSFTDTTKDYVEFDTLAGNYCFVIYHRNHIPIMTAGTQELNGATPLPYDFTTAQSQAFGSNAMKALAGSKFGLVAGDAGGNGQVATSDINAIIRPALGQSGYRNADVSLNGQVQTSDVNTFTRPNLGRGTQVPSRPITEKEEEQ